jgi:Fe2+ transport system protein FeoA
MALLSELRIGEQARVTDVATSGAIGVRLLEMGLVPGVDVRLLGAAPWGDPLEFELLGYRLSLRKAEAAQVTVAMQADQRP